MSLRECVFYANRLDMRECAQLNPKDAPLHCDITFPVFVDETTVEFRNSEGKAVDTFKSRKRKTSVAKNKEESDEQ